MKKLLLLSLPFFFLNINAQCAFSFNQNVQHVTCNGLSDGSAWVNPTAGTGPYTFSWKVGNTVISTNDTVTGLPAGTYKIVINDQGAACMDSMNVTITQPTLLSTNAFMTNPSCSGVPTGGACANANGGTPPYTYQWTPTFQNVNCVNGLAPGMYTVTTTDASGCVATTSVFVMIDNITLNLNTTNSGCTNSTGSITAIANSAYPPFSYSWSNGSTAPNNFNLTAGTYTVTVVDGMGCQMTQTATVLAATNITSLTTTIVPAACGQNNGSVTVTGVNGGIPSTYSFQGINYNTVNSFTGYGAGSYILQVTDTGGCVYTTNVAISNSNFNTQLNAVMPGCNLCNGSVSTNVIGGSAPYTYQWSNNANTSSVSGLCSGNYQVMVTDANGCISYADTSLTPPAAPVIITDSIHPLTCLGISTGSISVHATGGVAPYSYLWNTVPAQTTSTMYAQNTGMYTVSVTDAGGCTINHPIYLSNSNNIYVSFVNLQAPNCSANGLISVTANGGTPPYSYNWSNADTGSIISGLTSGSYSVTVTDINGCQGNANFNLPNYCYNLIRGRVYNDLNQNCIQDMGEPGIAGKTIITSTGQYGYTNSQGDYFIQLYQMSTNVSLSNYNNPNYYSVTCPVTGTNAVNFSMAGDTLNNVDFAIYQNPNYVDVSLHPGWYMAHPGFQKKYWILFANNSPTSQNILVRFTYDQNLTVDSIRAPGIHYPAQHKIEWTFNNVPAGQQWNWSTNPEAYLHVPASMSIIDSISSKFEIFPFIGDAYQADNVLDIREPITGSRDPNEKSVIPEGNILNSDSILLYTVHFQNNGNDTCYTVVVEDTLSQYLEPASLIPGASSHPYTFNLSGQGLMTWRFDHIMLPDSLTNEPESNGWFNYTVHLKPGLNPGTIIHNTAYIYFDYNNAVITNTTTNTLVLLTSENESDSQNSAWLVYPNPAKDAIMIQYDCTENSATIVIEIYNMNGELVLKKSMPSLFKGKNLSNLDLAKLITGIYFVKLSDGKTSFSKKLIVQH